MEGKGSLGKLGIAEIIEQLNREVKTGVLHLRKGENNKQILFKNGKIIFVIADVHKKRLGELMVEKGFIHHKDVQSAIELQKRKDIKFGDALLELGAIDKEQLNTFLANQAEEEIFEILNWTEGDYQFSEGEVDEELVFSQTTQSLLSEGAKKLQELAKIARTLKLDTVLYPVLDEQSNISLKAQEWRILSLVDGKRTVREILQLTTIGVFTTFEILNNLLFNRLIKKEEKEGIGVEEEEILKLFRITLFISWYSAISSFILKIIKQALGNDFINLIKINIQGIKDRYSLPFKDVDIDEDGILNWQKIISNSMELPEEEFIGDLKDGMKEYITSLLEFAQANLPAKIYQEAKKILLKGIDHFITNGKDALEGFSNEIKKIMEEEISLEKELEIAEKGKDFVKEEIEEFITTLESQEFPVVEEIKELKDEIMDKPVEKENLADIMEDIKLEEQTIDEGMEKSAQIPEGEGDSFERELEEAIVEDKGEKEANEEFNKGIFAFKNFKYVEAIRHFDRTLKINPQHTEAKRYKIAALEKGSESFWESINLSAIRPEIISNDFSNIILDASDGYLLSKLDGRSDLDTLVKITGMKKEKILLSLYYLYENGIIALNRELRKKADSEAERAEENIEDQEDTSRSEDSIRIADYLKEEEREEKEPEKKEQPAEMEDEEDAEVIDKVAIRVLERKTRSKVLMALNRAKNKDYYQLLGIQRTASPAIMKKAFLINTKICNPQVIERLKDPQLIQDTKRLFELYSTAYQTLSDPKKRKEYDRKLKEIKEQQDQKKKTANEYFQEGMVAYREQDFDKAEEAFKKAIELFPNNPVYHDMLTEVKNLNRAKRGYIRYKAGILAYEQGKFEEALVHLAAAIENSPLKTEWIEKILEVYQKVPQKVMDSFKYWTMLIEQNPTDQALRNKYARLLKSHRRYQEAADMFYISYKWDKDSPHGKEALEELKALKKEGYEPTELKKKREEKKKGK